VRPGGAPFRVTLEQVAWRVLRALDDAGVAHMLVGGLTSNYYGIPRATQDVDIVVKSPPSSRQRGRLRVVEKAA